MALELALNPDFAVFVVVAGAAEEGRNLRHAWAAENCIIRAVFLCMCVYMCVYVGVFLA